MSLSDFKNKVAEEVRAMWQARVLLGSSGKMQRVVIVALAKEYPQALQALLRACGIEDLERPFLCSYATITPSGRVACEMIEKDGSKKFVAIYHNEDEFISEMRKLADKLKLSDKDRTEMFLVLQKWVASDRRVGLLGQRLAS
jgi:hypothetical protein